jgi:hypothetical protein
MVARTAVVKWLVLSPTLLAVILPLELAPANPMWKEGSATSANRAISISLKTTR